jgi:hypothetical protein
MAAGESNALEAVRPAAGEEIESASRSHRGCQHAGGKKSLPGRRARIGPPEPADAKIDSPPPLW